MIGAKVHHVLCGKAAVQIDLDAWHLLQLLHPVIAHADVFAHPRQGRLAHHTPAQSPPRFGQRHPVAARTQGARRLQPRRPCADNQNLTVGPARVDLFRVPATPPFFAHRRILGAADRHGQAVAGIADVAADTFADILKPPFGDLVGQVGVGNRRARGPDQIGHPGFHHPHHRIGRGIAAHRHHRLCGDRADPFHVRLQRAFLDETRGAHLQRIVLDVDVPKIRHFGHHGEHLLPFAQDRLAVFARFGIGGETHGHGAAVADGILGFLDQFTDQTGAVFQGSAVFVAAGVGFGVKEMRQQVAVRGIDIDKVKLGRLGAQGGVAVPAPEIADVGFVHRAALERMADAVGPGAYVHRHQPRGQVGAA